METRLIFNNLTEVASVPSGAKMLIIDEKGKIKKAPVQGGDSGDSLWESGDGENSVQTKGTVCRAMGESSVAEGELSETGVTETIEDWREGKGAHAEGGNTTAAGNYSHTEGNSTVTNNPYEHAEGHFNYSHYSQAVYPNANNTIHSVGIGSNLSNRKNAFEIMQNGDTYLYGVGNYDGTNPSAANTLQSIVSNANSGLITVSRDSELEYDESENAFQSVIESTAELQEYFTTPGKYNLLVSVYGNADMGNTDDGGNPTINQNDVCGYMANHFCCLNASGLAIAQCYDSLEYEGTTTHFTSVSFDASENKCYVTYQGLMGDAKLLASENAKVSVYLQKLW